jgi:alginate biosynthesis protein AlgX
MVLPGALPPAARDLGFDAGLAATLHDDVLDRLSDAGVTTVNARRALRSRTDAPTMFGTDPRLTPAGVQALARAIGSVIVQDPDLALLPRGTWTTRTTAPVALPSALRTALQRHCRLTLPEVVAEGSATLRVDAATGATDTTLLGPQAAAGQIALLATLEAGDPALNLAGHLAQASGLPVQAYAVGWGDEPGAALAAISSYMTSPAFDTSPPAIIVWTFPMAAPLAQQGDGPLRELIAAARGGCTTPLAPVAGTRPGSVAFALPGLDPAAPGMLMVDLGPVAATRIEVAFQGPDGTLRSRFATRHPGQIATGRFFVPLDGLWPQGALAVTVQADVAPGAGLRAALCPPPPLVQP